MELQHSFTVPAPIDHAWSTLLDVEGVAPCFPGASLTGVEGDEFSGTVKVKLGPVSLQYVGKGRFVERDEAARRVVLEANGSDRRGNGTAGATVQARLEPDGDTATRVVVDTDLKVTGRPAQFGRGVLQDVGGKIIEQFAGCLAARMAAPQTALNDPALAELEELGEPERRLGLSAEGESPAVTTEERGAASTSSRAGSGRTSTTRPRSTPPAPTPQPTGEATDSALANDPALAELEELGEPERRLGLPAEGESPAVTTEERGAASTSSLAGSGRTSTAAPASGTATTSGRHAAPAGELDLGSVFLPSVARRYGPGLIAGLVAVLIVWTWRRRAR